MRSTRTKAHLRLVESILNISGLPAYFYAPPANTARFDGQRAALSAGGWFAIKPQDRRLTDEERTVLAQIEKRVFGC